MAFALNRFSTGDLTYISKHNSDNASVETAINALLTATSLGIGTGGTGTNAVMNDIWEQNGIIGASSYRVTCATSQTLSVTSGSVWMVAGLTRGRATSDVTLTFAGKTSGVYAILADTGGGLSISALSAVTAASTLQIYSVQYDAPNFQSAARLVPILLHGDDYNRMLSSPTYGSFTRVADRLSSIEGGILLDTFYAHSGFQSGTTWSYKNGQLRNNNQIVSTTGSVLPLTASATHYIEVLISTGVVSYTTGGWTASEAIALRLVSTAASAVVTNKDARTWAIAGAGGGGNAALANSGTTDGIWYLYRNTGATSSPVSTAAFAVDRGSLSDVAFRWNEALSYWEYTENGTSYIRFGTLTGVSLDSTAATLFTYVASAPAILATTLSTTTSTTILSLSAHVATSTTAVLIRGTAFDSAATSVGISSEPFNGIAFYRDSATTTAGAVAKIVAQTVSTTAEMPQMVFVPVSSQKIEYAAWAASDGSLRCSVYLVGYLTQGGISAIDARADGSTKGIATFFASDFNDNSSGLITIDYTNAQKASAGQPGFLTAADWTTFNNGGGSGFNNPFTTSGDILYATGTSALARQSAGNSGTVLTVSGGIPVWESATTLGLTDRVVSVATAASITPTITNKDRRVTVFQSNTQGAGTLTISVPTGTATDGLWLTFRLYLSNTQTPAFHSHYRSSTDLALPSTLSGGLEHYLGFQFNARVSTWDYLAKTFGF